MRIGRRLRLVSLAACVGLACVGLRGAGAAPQKPTLDAQIAQLDALRQQSIDAARAVQQRERTLGALDLAMTLMTRGVEEKNQELAQTRKAQEELLGGLERLARAPPEALAFAPEGPVERVRSGILIAAAVPALSAEARELTGDLAALARVRAQINTRRKDLDDARAALTKARDALAQLVTRRSTLIGQLLHDKGRAAESSKLGSEASDAADLIKRADAAIDQRDKDLLIQAATTGPIVKKNAPSLDPTKPKTLRALDAPDARMLWPVAGQPTLRFGESDKAGKPSQGLTLQAMADGVVAAPYDGRVDYVGPFHDYGLILIIRHSDGYHSLLAGLGHADVTTGQWLVAGEPVGTLPDAGDKNTGASLYLEVRNDGRPIDPQTRLVSRDQKSEDTRVHE
jgi:septal ring factor EnvC (AmiA/AmiB activator)